MPTPSQFNSEYEILNWLSRQDDFAHGVAELRSASAEGRLEGGRGLVEKWLSVYDDVTAGRVVSAPRQPAAAAPVVRAASAEAAAQAGRDDEDRRHEARAARALAQEAQLWAEAAREAASRADAAAGRLAAPVQRAVRWGRLAFAFALVALLLAAALGALAWPVLAPQLRALLLALPG